MATGSQLQRVSIKWDFFGVNWSVLKHSTKIIFSFCLQKKSHQLRTWRLTKRHKYIITLKCFCMWGLAVCYRWHGIVCVACHCNDYCLYSYNISIYRKATALLGWVHSLWSLAFIDQWSGTDPRNCKNLHLYYGKPGQHTGGWMWTRHEWQQVNNCSFLKGFPKKEV